MKYISIFFICFFILFSTTVFAEDVTLAWDAPTENADGSPCDDLAGYKIYYGKASRVYDVSVDVASLDTQYTIDPLPVPVPGAFVIDPKGTYIEAEDYNSITDGSVDANFSLKAVIPDYSGWGYLFTDGADATGWDRGTDGDHVSYKVFFSETGRYQVYVRGYNIDDATNSVTIGLNGVATGSFSNDIHNQWNLSTVIQSSYGVNYIDVPNPGLYEIDAWVRERGFAFDGFSLLKEGNPSDTQALMRKAVLFSGDITYYFAVTAYDTSNNESDYSNEVSITFTDASPDALKNFLLALAKQLTH